ncbi:MAG TPA: hypothetical protein VEF34_10040 [Syntrophobacteraceae bacterium]|nr:hypothetical protein [Syntrophobacteraceae bacterium]
MKTGTHMLRIIVSGLAIAVVAVLCSGAFITGHLPGLVSMPVGAQTANVPEINPDAKVELKQPDAASPPKAAWPALPHETLTAPLPEKAGCFYLVDDSWQKIACATDEDMKNLRRPVVADSIQSTRHSSTPAPGKPPITYTTPIIWGAVANELDNPTQSNESDILNNTETSNTFSIQTNTNTFSCSYCKKGSPFAQSQPGDTGWVQFVYQQSGSGKGADAWLCVWNIDWTVAGKTKNNSGYKHYCVMPSKSYTMLPLTGTGAPGDEYAEVIGYVDCTGHSKPGPNGCTLWAFAQLPWVKDGPSWWAVSAPDSLGLDGQWYNVGGAMYGEGSGSKAVFSNATLVTDVVAYSCETGSQHGSTDGGIFTPKACNPVVKNPTYFLTAKPSSYKPTGESNNLTNGQVTFGCSDHYDCHMRYTSTTD